MSGKHLTDNGFSPPFRRLIGWLSLRLVILAIASELEMSHGGVHPMRGIGLIIWLIAGLAAMITWMALAPTVYAHKAPSGFEYPASCCSGDKSIGDCQMISANVVRETPQGYAVVLLPGDHRLVTRRQSFRIPYGQQISAPDGNYHICLYPNEAVVFCFFAPASST